MPETATALPPDVRRWLRRAVAMVPALGFAPGAGWAPLFQLQAAINILTNLVAHRYLISQDSPALYITVVTNNRLPVFQKDPMKGVLCRAIDEARKHFLLLAYVVMIDHVHLLTSRPSTTSDVLRILKGLTARRVLDHLKGNNYLSSLAKLQHQERDRNYKYSLWQTEKNVLPIFSERLFLEKLNYIHLNPVRSGLVKRAIDYRWSSARIWQDCPAEDEPLQVDKDLIYWRRRPD